jgi:hypothetical protein
VDEVGDRRDNIVVFRFRDSKEWFRGIGLEDEEFREVFGVDNDATIKECFFLAILGTKTPHWSVHAYDLLHMRQSKTMSHQVTAHTARCTGDQDHRRSVVRVGRWSGRIVREILDVFLHILRHDGLPGSGVIDDLS